MPFAFSAGRTWKCAADSRGGRKSNVRNGSKADLAERLGWGKATRSSRRSRDSFPEGTAASSGAIAPATVARPVRRFTDDELVSAGGLAGIGDEKVRAQAAAYYLGMRTVDTDLLNLPPYRERIRREMPYAVQDRIRSRCGEQGREEKGAVIRSLPRSCRAGLDPATIARAVAQLRAAPEMDRDLTRYLTDIDQKLNAYKGAQRRARELRQALEDSLK